MKLGIVVYVPYLSPRLFLPAISRAIEARFEHIEIPDVWTSWNQKRISKIKRSLILTLSKAGTSRYIHSDPFFEATYYAFYRKVFQAMVSLVRDAIYFANKINGSLVTFHPLMYKGEIKDPVYISSLKHSKRMFLDAVKNLLEDAEDCGIILGLESFCWRNPGTFSSIFSSPKELVGFVRGLNSRNLGITLDIGHTFQNNVDICRLIRMCKGLLVNVHVHDSDGQRAHLSIGDGKIDFRSIIEALGSIGYSGALSLELLDASMNYILFNKLELGSFLKEPNKRIVT